MIKLDFNLIIRDEYKKDLLKLKPISKYMNYYHKYRKLMKYLPHLKCLSETLDRKIYKNINLLFASKEPCKFFIMYTRDLKNINIYTLYKEIKLENAFEILFQKIHVDKIDIISEKDLDKSIKLNYKKIHHHTYNSYIQLTKNKNEVDRIFLLYNIIFNILF